MKTVTRRNRGEKLADKSLVGLIVDQHEILALQAALVCVNINDVQDWLGGQNIPPDLQKIEMSDLRILFESLQQASLHTTTAHSGPTPPAPWKLPGGVVRPLPKPVKIKMSPLAKSKVHKTVASYMLPEPNGEGRIISYGRDG